MNQVIRPVQITSEAHLIQSFWKAPGAPVGVHINSMVLASRRPVVFDTGVAADRDGWLAAVRTVVDPDDSAGSCSATTTPARPSSPRC